MTLSPINTEGRPSASPGTDSPKYSPTGLKGTCDDKNSTRQTQTHTAKYRQTTTQTDRQMDKHW